MSNREGTGGHPATSPGTRVTGRWLHVVRVLWTGVALLTVYATVMSVIAFVGDWARGGILTEYLIRAGISPSVFFPLDFTLNTVVLAVFWVAAVFLIRRRRDDWLVFTTSALFLCMGLFATTFDANAGALVSIGSAHQIALFLLDFLTHGCALVFFGTFPNGRFFPRWLLPVFLLLGLGLLTEDAWRLIQQIPFPEGPVVLRILRVPVVNTAALFAQIYRWYHSEAETRQRTKLAVLGFALGVVANILEKLVLLQFGQTIYLITRPIMAASFVACVVLLLLALLRYRIWDFEFVINRSLVYGGLTVMLAVIFAGAFFGLRAFAEGILGTGQTGVAMTLSAVLVVGLFAPSRDRLRRIVDRRFYGIELDYRQAAREQAKLQEGRARTHIGDYTGLELLGKGGMGEVYRARHPSLKKYVAIKILPQHLAGDQESRRRFLREAETISRLKHPNVVEMHDFGESEGLPYMVMEYIDGQHLGAVLKQRGRLPLEEALPMLRDIASALDFAHESGIVHRDIKPSNVMIEAVTASGGRRTQRAVLMDFGIAKLYSALTQLTGSGGMIGTLDYIAPEQIRGAREVDRRADVYSFGVLAYQVLTGELPFKHSNLGAMVMAHLMQPAPDPRKYVAELPAETATAIARAMAKEPEDRFGSAGEFVRALSPAK